MPYIFRCYYCNEETELGYPPDEYHESCPDCGEDMCRACFGKGRCDSCQRRLIEEA